MIHYDHFVKGRALSELSTFRIGGPADYFVEVHSRDHLAELLCFCKREKLPYLVLGKGSNSLFHDDGFRGLVILNKIDFCESEGGTYHVGAGYSFSLLGSRSAKEGFSGLEFACGIPGSVGGAVFMNAGANGKETQEMLTHVEFFDEDGIHHHFSKNELQFGYRFSSFQQMKGAIVAATFVLEPCTEARKRQLEIIQRRKETQPLSEYSIGCIFRNPKDGPSAGRLIEEAGLKGLQVGGAKVSEIHANFMINTDEASCEDVKELTRRVKQAVFEKYGIELHEEVRVIPP